eukprot:gene6230-6467_t
MTAPQGQPVNYTITVTNIGTNAASNVTIRETLPPGLQFAPGYNTSLPPGCSIAGQVLTCSPGTPINVGGTFTIPVQVVGSTTGTFTPSAAVTSAGDTNLANNGPVNATITVTPGIPDVGITATPGPLPAVVNTPVNFTLTVTNTGQGPATNVTVRETLPPGVIFNPTWTPPAGCNISGQVMTCRPGDLPAGNTILIPVQVIPTAPGTFTPSATVTANGDVTPGNNGPANTTIVAAAPDMTIGKSPPSGSVNVNQTFPYNITLTNVGSAPATNVTMVETLPAGLTFVGPAPSGCVYSNQTTMTCTPANPIAVNGTLTIPVQVQASQPGTYNTSAVVTASGDSNTTNNGPARNTIVVTIVGTVDVAVTKSPSTIQATVGNAVTYVITLRNQGSLPANNVTMTETLPTGLIFDPASNAPSGCTASGQVLNCLPGTISPGGSVNFTVQVVPTQPGTFNTSAVVSATNDANPSNNGPAINTIIAVIPVRPDISITKTGPNNSVLIGQVFTFTLVVNVANAAALNVKVQDVLPAGLQFTNTSVSGCTKTGNALNCNLGNLAAGSVWTASVEVVATTAGAISNTATVNTTTPQDPGNENNDQSTTTANVLRPLPEATCGDSTPDTASGVRVDCASQKTVFDESKVNSKPPTFANCCVGTCANPNPANPPTPQTCPPGYQYNPSRDNLTNPTPALCCDRVLLPDVSIVAIGPTVAHKVGEPFTFSWFVK